MTDIRKDLLPCPFCGTETVYLNPEKDGGINCPHCLVRMPNECCDIVELVNTWNTRAHDIDGLIAEISRLKYPQNECEPASYKSLHNATTDSCIDIIRKHFRKVG